MTPRSRPFAAWTLALLAGAPCGRSHAQSLPPLSASHGAQANERRGASVADAGDLDGDGALDFWVGSPFDSTAGVQAGAVRAVSGHDGSVIHALFGDAAVDHFGWSLANLGDLDGDGVAELAIGAPDNDFQGQGAGAVRVVSGASGATRFTAHGSATGAAFGCAVAAAGDVDGDGVRDFCAGSPLDPTAAPGAGAVDVRSGVQGAVLARHLGSGYGDHLGISVAGAGDVDQDGRPDVIGGADQAQVFTGYARIWSGSTGVLLRTLPGLYRLELFGGAVAGGQDLDGDGVPDVIVGASAARRHGLPVGAVRAFSGATGAVLFEVPGTGTGEAFGSAVALVPDLDGDGRADLAAGGAFEGGAPGAAGVVRALGSRTQRCLRTWRGRSGGDRFGTALAVLADRDGDGRADFLAGAPKDDAPLVDSGACFALSTRSAEALAYCTAKLNSQGCTPSLGGGGFASASGAATLALAARRVLPQKPGLFLFSSARAATPFLGGTLCVAPPVQRSPALTSKAGGPPPCAGVLAFSIDAAAVAQFSWQPGSVLHAQAWYRDPLHPDGTASGLSDALEFAVWE